MIDEGLNCVEVFLVTKSKQIILVKLFSLEVKYPIMFPSYSGKKGGNKLNISLVLLRLVIVRS